MLQKIKILHVISNFGIGGAEVWLIALLRYYKQYAEKLEVQVDTDIFLTNGVRDCLDDEAEALGARLIYARYSRETLPTFVATWRQTLAAGRYDAIHDHQDFTAGWHFLFGTGYLPPVRIAHLHNSMSHQRSYSSGLLRKKTVSLGYRFIAMQASHLLSTSRKLITEQGFDNLHAARHLQKLTVYCGFDPNRFLCDRDEALREMREEFRLSHSAKLLLFVGRLDGHSDDALNEKNPSFCLEVARECASRDPNFICLLAGSGETMRTRLQDRVRSWGMEQQILLIGPRSDVPILMAGADLLLFPSLAEGLGMVAVEAQSAGLPVIASDAVPSECRVIDGMVDFLPLAAGVEFWAQKVMEKLQNIKPDARAANRAVLNSQFSIDNSAKRLLQIYRGEI